MDEQLLKEFLDGAEELFESLFGDIGALRVQHGDGRARRELVGRIFRHVHTMKGTASAAGLEATAEAAHEFESALDAVRMGRVALDPAALDLFDDTVQALAENLSAVAHAQQQNGATRAQHRAVSPVLLRRLRRLASSEAVQTSSPAQAKQADALFAALPEEIRHSLSEYELRRLSETTGEGAGVCVVEVSFGLDNFDEQFRRLSDTLAETGEIISTLPGIEPHAPERVHFRILYATPERSAPQVAARIAHFGASLVVCGAKPAETTGDESREGETVAGTPGTPALTAAIAPLTNFVRVPLDKLDGIIASAHELLNKTNAALDLALASDATDDARREIEESAAGIRLRFAELEERLLGLRIVSVGPTLERAARAGAAAARGLGIDLEFATSGGEVRLDKSLADALAEPLLHLVRNAVAHGIEPPAERLAAGKAARGRVRLEASYEASYHNGGIVLRVADDGRGIDPAQVTRAAVERGLVERGAQLTEAEALRVIFRTGFTTAREVSTFAGRGVGLDIVERAIESAGGELRVWTHAGAGTTFEIRLPATRK